MTPFFCTGLYSCKVAKNVLALIIYQSHPELTCGDLDLSPLGITPEGNGEPDFEGLFSPLLEFLEVLLVSNSCFLVIFHSWFEFLVEEEDTAL